MPATMFAATVAMACCMGDKDVPLLCKCRNTDYAEFHQVRTRSQYRLVNILFSLEHRNTFMNINVQSSTDDKQARGIEHAVFWSTVCNEYNHSWSDRKYNSFVLHKPVSHDVEFVLRFHHKNSRKYKYVCLSYLNLRNYTEALISATNVLAAMVMFYNDNTQNIVKLAQVAVKKCGCYEIVTAEAVGYFFMHAKSSTQFLYMFHIGLADQLMNAVLVPYPCFLEYHAHVYPQVQPYTMHRLLEIDETTDSEDEASAIHAFANSVMAGSDTNKSAGDAAANGNTNDNSEEKPFAIAITEVDTAMNVLEKLHRLRLLSETESCVDAYTDAIYTVEKSIGITYVLDQANV
jgi:hypothetical protein